MHVQVKDKMTVKAPAHKVWRVLAHEFDNIGQWSSGITESRAIMEIPVPEGAQVGGRVCLSPGFFGDAQEEFTYYDEQSMRFGYQAIGELPRFFTHAENNWSVRSLDPNKSVVEFRADVDLKLFPGLFLILLMPLIKYFLGTRTLEELKYYVGHDQPHPRKLKAQQKQIKIA